MDYELLDSGNGRRLERFGKYIIDRPDPEVMWQKGLSEGEWQKADAVFRNNWIKKPNFPESWVFEIENIKVHLKLTPFKHLGIFPEQEEQWKFINETIKSRKTTNQPQILNLFAYTGVASLFALEAGAMVTHVDASRPAITWFKENQELSGLTDKPARVIIDDCLKFTQREIRRGKKYDGIILDPPVYGHGPNGEKWSFNKNFPELIENVSQLLSDNPLFVIVNAYAISTSSTSLSNIMQDKLKRFKGSIKHGELTLKEKSEGRILSTGIWTSWNS